MTRTGQRDVDAIPPARLTSFAATDGVVLPGLLFEPRRRTRDAVIYLHGNGDSSIFYSARTTRMAAALLQRRITFFPFNNRGALQLKWLKRLLPGGESENVTAGMSHEVIADAVHDIDGAARFLRGLGYERLHLVGYSTGANKICVYHARKPRNRFLTYTLMGPGDDTGLYYASLGPRRFFRTLGKSRQEIAQGRGDRLAPRGASPFLISWRSLYDTINPDGDYNVFPFNEAINDLRLSKTKPLFAEYRKLRKPTLVVFGENDEYAYGMVPRCMELLEEHAPPRIPFRFEVLPDTDHGFHRKEEELGRLIGESVVGR